MGDFKSRYEPTDDGHGNIDICSRQLNGAMEGTRSFGEKHSYGNVTLASS